jgi:hypothetical protein
MTLMCYGFAGQIDGKVSLPASDLRPPMSMLERASTRPITFHGASWAKTCGRVAALAAGIVVLVIGGATFAAAAEDKPALTVVGNENLELVVGSPYGNLWRDDLSGTLRVTLHNPTTAPVRPAFVLIPNGSNLDCPTSADGFSLSTVVGAVPAGQTESYELKFEVDEDCIGIPSSLLVSSDGLATVSSKVATKRDVGGWYFWPPLIVALGAGATFWGITRVVWGDLRNNRTPLGDSWSFSGSWLTSISAVTTALAGVLAATGFVTELLPGIPLGNFLGLSLTFGGLVVAAPLVYASQQVTDRKVVTPAGAGGNPTAVTEPVLRGRLAGIFNAGALTCAGAAGLIAMLMVLTTLSNASEVPQIVVTLLLLAIGVVAGVYVVASTRNTVTAAREFPPPAAEQPISEAQVAALERFQYAEFTGTL